MSAFAHALGSRCPTVPGATAVAAAHGLPEHLRHSGGAGWVAGELVLDRWKGGKAPAEEICKWVKVCADSGALRLIATRERRSTVCAAAATNPHTPPDALAHIATRHRGSNAATEARQGLERWGRTAPLDQVLDAMWELRDAGIYSAATGLRTRNDIDVAAVRDALVGREQVEKSCAQALLAQPDVTAWHPADLQLLAEAAGLEASLQAGLHSVLDGLLERVRAADEGDLWHIVATHASSGRDDLAAAARHGDPHRPPRLGTCVAMADRADAPLDAFAECRWASVGTGPLRGRRDDWGAAIVARLLTERFGDDNPQVWSLAAGLGDDWDGTAGELVDAVAAVLDTPTG